MMTNKILTIILTLVFSLTLMDMGLCAGTAGILPGANVQQEKTEKKDEEKKEKEKKEEEKNKKEKRIKRVWTDEDLKEIRKERLNITEVPPEPDEKDKKKKEEKKVLELPDLVKDKTEEEKVDPKKTEKYWRERKKALVDKINKNKEEIKNMQAKLFQLQNQLNGTDIVSQRAQIEQEIRDTYNKLENFKKGLDRMQKELEDLPNEVRKAGGLPGWLRD